MGDTLYFGANDGYFYAIKAQSGQIQWTFPTKSEILGKPFVHANFVYFVTNNTLYALEKNTGHQKWLYTRPNTLELTIRTASRPFIHDSVLYVGFTDGSFVALDSQNGQLKWEQQLSGNKEI